MSSEQDKDLYKLVGKYEQFSSQVLEELREVQKSLKECNTRMSNIEARQSQNNTCLFHADVITLIEKQKKKDEEHDAKLGVLDKNAAVQEVKLNRVDQAKADAGALSAIYVVVKLILTGFGFHLP